MSRRRLGPNLPRHLPGIAAAIRDQKHSELMIPRTVLAVDEIPLPRTGKTDYPGLTQWIECRLTALAAE